MKIPKYERDHEYFDADAYKVRQYPGIAFSVLGWAVEPDEDSEWSGIFPRTGEVAARMIGDDRLFFLDEEDIAPIRESEYCGECGQIGCPHGAAMRVD